MSETKSVVQLENVDSRLVEDALRRGVSRRDVLRLAASTGMIAAAGSILAGAGKAHAQTPKKGGRIRAASLSSSAADTLDPAKGALSTDYTRAFMFYSGLTQLDANLAPQLALAEEIRNKRQITSLGQRQGLGLDKRRDVHDRREHCNRRAGRCCWPR